MMQSSPSRVATRSGYAGASAIQSTPLSHLTLALACACALACHCTAGDPGPGDAVYRVRGQVVSQDGSGPDARVAIAHEAIPSFKDRDGKPGRMPAMTMAFGLAPGVPATKLTPGSRWQLTFEVRWSREPVLRITRVESLAPGTELTLAAH